MKYVAYKSGFCLAYLISANQSLLNRFLKRNNKKKLYKFILHIKVASFFPLQLFVYVSIHIDIQSIYIVPSKYTYLLSVQEVCILF